MLGESMSAPQSSALLCLVEEVAERPAGAAAEVEHPSALEGPVVGQQVEQRAPGLAAVLLVDDVWLVAAVQ